MYLTFCFRWGWVGVASLMVRFLGASCYSGQWIFGLSLFLGLALGFLCIRVSLWGSRGAAWLLGFVFGVALGYGSRGMGSVGLFVAGCGFWGLGLWLFLSASGKVLVFGNECGFRSRILGAAAPLGTLFFLSLGIFGSGPFSGWGLEVWLCLVGLWGGTRARGV